MITTSASSDESRTRVFLRTTNGSLHQTASQRTACVFLYSLDQVKSFQVTDGMSDAVNPVWDKNGKYLYFTASTNLGLSTSGLDMSAEEHRVTRNVYLDSSKQG